MISYTKLFSLLVLRGIKAYELQEMISTSAATMAKIKKGEQINTGVICRICAALNVQPGEIMEFIPDEKTE